LSNVGLHLRLGETLIDLAHKAHRLNLSFFQCFFVSQRTRKLLQLTSSEIHSFVQLRRQYFTQLYLHGSYWINLSSITYNGYRTLERELTIAKKLEFTHMILHPGFAKGAKQKSEGIQALARALNKLLKYENDITIVLENTTHGNLSVGSDILDFKYVLEQLDKPDKIAFCIDTSHAYSFGYDMVKEKEQDLFINFLEKTIGIDRIILIHLNDSKRKLGSRVDQHAAIGEGYIGKKSLKRFMMHPQLRHIPVLLELPVLKENEEHALLMEVRKWREEERIIKNNFFMEKNETI
jgi:deoxyribonuclease IV